MSVDRDDNQKISLHTLQNHKSFYSDKFSRILTDDFPEEKYKPREKDQDRTTIHYGQRKLHLSEVEFLTRVCKELEDRTYKKIVLIYAGAAPGVHINLLKEMFPFIKFVLVDPAKFAIQSEPDIEIKQEFFTDLMAQDLRHEYDNYIRLFISDIRRAGPGMQISDDQIEDEVLEDMRSQKHWYDLLQPFRSLLKFRLPYVENRSNSKTEIEYLNGDIYFQIWPPCSSSETRLFVKENAGSRKYDCTKYENQMFRFNNFERANCYEHEIKIEGFDHCYDCRAEVHVFQEYVDNFQKIYKLSKGNGFTSSTPKSVDEYIQILSDHLSANKKMIRITFKKKEYEIKFTDVVFGKRIDEILSENNIAKCPYGNKWNRNKNFNGFFPKFDNNKKNCGDLKKRLEFPKDRRLVKGPFPHRK